MDDHDSSYCVFSLDEEMQHVFKAHLLTKFQRVGRVLKFFLKPCLVTNKIRYLEKCELKARGKIQPSFCIPHFRPCQEIVVQWALFPKASFCFDK